VDTPILTGAIGEEAGNLFATDYFDLGKAYLAQTGQLYVEAAAAALGKIDPERLNVNGGAIALGHPVGATGVYQLAEAYLQVTDQAGKNQVDGAMYAATQNIGGVDTTSAVHILGRAA